MKFLSLLLLLICIPATYVTSAAVDEESKRRRDTATAVLILKDRTDIVVLQSMKDLIGEFTRELAGYKMVYSSHSFSPPKIKFRDNGLDLCYFFQTDRVESRYSPCKMDSWCPVSPQSR